MTFNNPVEVLFDFAKLPSGAMDKLKAIGYYDAPASKGHHLAVKGPKSPNVKNKPSTAGTAASADFLYFLCRSVHRQDGRAMIQ